MLFNYNILVYKKIVPFVILGMHYNIPISSNFNDLYVDYNETIKTVNVGAGRPGENEPSNSSITTNYTEPISNENIKKDNGFSGFIIGGGLKYQLSDRSLLKFELRYMTSFQGIITGLNNEQEVESFLRFKSISSFVSFQYSIF